MHGVTGHYWRCKMEQIIRCTATNSFTAQQPTALPSHPPDCSTRSPSPSSPWTRSGELPFLFCFFSYSDPADAALHARQLVVCIRFGHSAVHTCEGTASSCPLSSHGPTRHTAACWNALRWPPLTPDWPPLCLPPTANPAAHSGPMHPPYHGLVCLFASFLPTLQRHDRSQRKGAAKDARPARQRRRRRGAAESAAAAGEGHCWAGGGGGGSSRGSSAAAVGGGSGGAALSAA